MSKNKNNADENGIPVAAKKQRRKLPKLVKILIALLIVAAVVVAGLIIARKIITSKQTANTVYRVTTETYENVIEISGVVAAAQSQTLQAQSSGTVTAVYVKQGDSVKAGDVIIQMDDTAEKYNLAKHDYETQTVKITGSYREYQLKLTQRESLVQKINERKVTATFDGIIANINVAVGDFLESKEYNHCFSKQRPELNRIFSQSALLWNILFHSVPPVSDPYRPALFPRDPFSLSTTIPILCHWSAGGGHLFDHRW